MASTFLSKLKELRVPVRSLIFLYWIYEFTRSMTDVFIQIAVFKMFSNVVANIVGTMFMFTGIMVGFCVFGYILSYFRLDAKQGFYYSFFSFGLGLLLLSQVTTVYGVYLAMFIHGMGSGFYYLTAHTYELTETVDKERDFYSSILNSGVKFLSIFGPLCAVLIIWFATQVFHVSSLKILFTVAPLCYVLGLFCFKGIRSYKPERITLEDVRYFLTEKRNRGAQVYLACDGSTHIIEKCIAPLTLFYILGSELRVGLYTVIATSVAVLLTLFLSNYRTPSNRISFFGFAAFGVGLFNILLGYFLTFTMLVIFTIVDNILVPIMNVSNHVVALKTMESIGQKGSDFYATMILRDFSFWVWRMMAGSILLVIAVTYQSTRTTITVGLYLLGVAVIIMFFGARSLVKKMV